MPHCAVETTHGPHFHFNMRTVVRVTLLVVTIVVGMADVVGMAYIDSQHIALARRMAVITERVSPVPTPPEISAKLD